MKKSLLAAGVVTAIGLTGVAGAATYAASSTQADPMSGLVGAIASKFNLDKSEVQKVFDEQRSQMETERENEIKDELAQLVKDGKLTQAQADKITAKREELKKEREANRTSGEKPSKSDMKKNMEARKTALEKWAKENGIDSQYLRYVFGGGHHGGHDRQR
ncbi:MAG TPA: hypothetical protein VGE34_03435 [Candidatus Saccharimonadales bacterium]